ncbi:Transcription factor domain, fungi [Phaffia rhodozyma]|uniref:Transcription factor domain, fungi n=1 Tax=Phaffia rhodozyma TaxID=264483 RepID=A0A0F7SN71_PHARH|nr:Transcription factor domain, fungi [Phaffia rhodozyma]
MLFAEARSRRIKKAAKRNVCFFRGWVIYNKDFVQGDAQNGANARSSIRYRIRPVTCCAIFAHVFEPKRLSISLLYDVRAHYWSQVFETWLGLLNMQKEENGKLTSFLNRPATPLQRCITWDSVVFPSSVGITYQKWYEFCPVPHHFNAFSSDLTSLVQYGRSREGRILEDKISRLESILSLSESNESAGFSLSSTDQRKMSSAIYPYPVLEYPKPSTPSRVSHPSRLSRRHQQATFTQAFQELWNTSSSADNITVGPPSMQINSVTQSTVSSNSSAETNSSPMHVPTQFLDQTDTIRRELEPWEFDFSSLDQENVSKSTAALGDLAPMQLGFFSSLQLDSNQSLSEPFLISIGQPNEYSPSSLAQESPSVPLVTSSTEDRTATLKTYIQEHGDVPIRIRDLLLGAFFKQMKTSGVMIHVERFWSKLKDPVKNERPHPAFLFAMYISASQLYPDESVQASQSLFYHTARKHLEDGIDDQDERMIDLIRAATVLGTVAYSKARFRSAWVLGGIAMRLCALARLQSISFPFCPSSFQNHSLGPPNPFRAMLARVKRQVRPPKDGIECGEYIWAFWQAWGLERCHSTAAGWTPSMHWSEIETPFPLPLEQYEHIEVVNSRPITAVYGLFDDSQHTLVGDLSASCQFIGNLLLNEAARLLDEFIHPSTRNKYLSQMSNRTDSFSPSSQEEVLSEDLSTESDSSAGPITEPVPSEILRLQDALLKFVRLGMKSSWDSWGDTWGVDSEVVLLHCEILSAFALVYRQRAVFDTSARAKAVSSARSMVKLIRVISDVNFRRCSFVMLVSWRNAAHILLEEVRRLRMLGNEEEALTVSIDTELIVLAMQRMGEVYTVGDTCQNSAIEAIKRYQSD